MATKIKTRFFCQECGYETAKWLGQCPGCKAWNSLVEEPVSVTAGGKERYDSVYAGLLCCQDTDYVYIHDGARPFVTEEMIQRGYEAVKRTNACVMGMPSKDTVKLADPSGYIKETPDRKIVWNIQTPQIFSYDLIRGAYESIRKKDMSNVTDDAMVVEQETGTKILLVEGSYQNIKITTPEDLAVAEAFLRY